MRYDKANNHCYVFLMECFVLNEPRNNQTNIDSGLKSLKRHHAWCVWLCTVHSRYVQGVCSPVRNKQVWFSARIPDAVDSFQICGGAADALWLPGWNWNTHTHTTRHTITHVPNAHNIHISTHRYTVCMWNNLLSAGTHSWCSCSSFWFWPWCRYSWTTHSEIASPGLWGFLRW